MINNIKDRYNDFVENNFISHDQRQVDVLIKMENIWKQNRKLNFLSNQKKLHGIYLYGSVGIGKTFILNLFNKYTGFGIKSHFNHLMMNIHSKMNTVEKKDNKNIALEEYIKNISLKYKVFFIDELHIFNIVDALIIKKIFFLFKKYKIFILISSNFNPNQLYKDGLQRNDFLPFIEYITEFFEVIHLDQTVDYRRLMLNQSKTYFTPVNNQTTIEFNKLFDRFVDIKNIYSRKIKTGSREIILEKCTNNIAYCSFNVLCNNNLGNEDYKNIAKEFNLIFIRNIPQFLESQSDQCRRFIGLIDMLYEQKRSVVILAEYPINQLCKIPKLLKEFERTSSRLYEMTIISLR